MPNDLYTGGISHTCFANQRIWRNTRCQGSASIRGRNCQTYQSFEQQDLYPHPTDKAAAILESVVSNHPFLDGNKRVGYALMLAMLAEHGLDLKASIEERYDFVMSVARGQMNFESIRKWVHANVG